MFKVINLTDEAHDFLKTFTYRCYTSEKDIRFFGHYSFTLEKSYSGYIVVVTNKPTTFIRCANRMGIFHKGYHFTFEDVNIYKFIPSSIYPFLLEALRNTVVFSGYDDEVIQKKFTQFTNQFAKYKVVETNVEKWYPLFVLW